MSRRQTKVSGNYISGLSSPIAADGDGGFSISEGDDYVSSLIRGALLAAESSNPFLNIGLGYSAAFANAEDRLSVGRLTAQIEAVFSQLDRENIASLVSIEQVSSEDGELTVKVSYINKENNRRSEITAAVDTTRGVGL